jgi:magnesium transporter
MEVKRIEELLQEKKFVLLKEELKSFQPADVAEVLDDLDIKNAIMVFRLLPKEVAADVFSRISPERQSEISMMVNEKELAEILDELYFDDKIDFLEEMPANVVKRILKNSTETERKLINQFLNYPENSAGSLMTIEFIDLKKEMSVGDALEKIRRIGMDKETIYTCYAIDPHRKLEGIVSLKDLVLAPAEKKVQDIMKTDIIYVDTYDDQEDIADIFKKYDLLSVPVVDQEKRLVGIITIDDIVDVIEEENTEDFHRMAAVNPSDQDYLSAGILDLARKRITWLLFLMISATFTGYIIRYYEKALESVVALVAFIPMLMGTGGNAGSQSATLIIRGMALGEIEFKDILKVMWKEVRISFLVGVVLAFLNFLRIYYLEHYPTLIALTVSLALLFVIMFSKLIGGILPIIAKKVGLDPAIMASPLISTLVDAISLTVYFTLAMWILGIKP